MSIQFNWYELRKISELPESDVIVIFGLFVGPDKPLADTGFMLKSKLNIEFVPHVLFHKNILKEYKTGIFMNYRTIEPQSYIRKGSFLHSKISAKSKSEYIYMLSLRAINNENNWIPESFVENNKILLFNPLITRKNKKLIFHKEI